MIKDGQLKEMLTAWDLVQISDSVIDLMTRILVPDPNHRITLDDILSHAWMQEADEAGRLDV